MSPELLLASLSLFFLVLLLPALFLATQKLGPRSTGNQAKNLTYESGVTAPYGKPNAPVGVRFYLVAILYVIFAIEVTFMFPWAVNLRTLGTSGLFEMFAFIGMLLVGLVYVYWKKALSWQ